MQKWLDDQATLVSGARLQPAYPTPRSPSKSQSRYRNNKNGSKTPNFRPQDRRPRRNSKSQISSPISSDGSANAGQYASPNRSSRSVSRSFPDNYSKNRDLISQTKGNNRESPGKSSPSPTMSKTSRKNTHRTSIQSASSSIDSAGGLLLGRHVLVPRRDHGNRLYLGVIKTQKKDKRFGVVFCIPYAGHDDDDQLEYCMQEVDIDDILSYPDLYRHAICEKDDVLVPAVLLQPHSVDISFQIDPPFAGYPYVLAVVHKGFEPRSSRINDSPGRKTSTLVVKLAGGRKPRLRDIPAGCALWIPEKQARQLYSQGCHFIDQQDADESDSSPYHGGHDLPCMHGAPNSLSRNNDFGDTQSQHSTKSSEEFRRICAASSSTSKGDGENSDVSSVLEKRLQGCSNRRSAASSSRSKRPQWQYWGKEGIPSLLDPPSHEPYMPRQVFRPVSTVYSQSGNEWPEAHFAIVNHSLENISAQNDSTRVYEAMRQDDQPRPSSKFTDLPVAHSQPNMKMNGGLENPFLESRDTDEDGLADLSLRELYRRRIREDLNETKAASACNFKRRKSLTKSIRSQ